MRKNNVLFLTDARRGGLVFLDVADYAGPLIKQSSELPFS